ncbi:MAG: hypothetical protein WCG91_00800 [Candidatus Shapirobacteria bacterium]
MDNIQYENELVFQVEPENKKDNKVARTKKIVKVARQNLIKLSVDRLNGRTGEC